MNPESILRCKSSVRSDAKSRLGRFPCGSVGMALLGAHFWRAHDSGARHNDFQVLDIAKKAKSDFPKADLSTFDFPFWDHSHGRLP